MATILVVAPDSRRSAALAVMLQPEHTVLEARNACEALASVEQHHIDVVFVDSDSEGEDGNEAFEAVLRGAPDTAVLPVNGTSGGRELLLNRVVAAVRMAAMVASARRDRAELASYRDRAELENQLARHVFETIVSGQGIDVDGLTVRSFPMNTFSGDVVLAAQLPDGRLRVLLGDFSGHGLSAAIGALPVADAFYAMSRRGLPLTRLAVELNEKLLSRMPRNIFFAACMVDLDVNRGELAVINAGMPDILIVSADSHIRQRVSSRTLPLGIVAAQGYDDAEALVGLFPADRVLICSDGVLEAVNSDGQMLGEAGLDVLVEGGTGATWLDGIVEGLNDFRGAAARTDDTTLVCIEHTAELVSALSAHAGATHGPDLGIDVTFSPEALRREVDLHTFTDALKVFEPLAPHTSSIQLVLGELITNAVEHGLLGLCASQKQDADGFAGYYERRRAGLLNLSSGEVRLSLRVHATDTDPRVRIRVEDTGPGFSPGKSPADSQPKAAGRGLALVRALCREVTFRDGGAVVEAEFAVKDARHKHGARPLSESRRSRSAGLTEEPDVGRVLW